MDDMKRTALLLAAASLASITLAASTGATAGYIAVDGTPIRVAPIPDSLRRTDELPTFYTRHVMIRSIPIIGSDKPSDYAFLEAAYTLDHVLAESPAWVIDALIKNKVRLGIIGIAEYTMDIPENQTDENLRPSEAAFQDRRSRGLGGLPLATCAEENVLNLPSDPYRTEAIGIHEFAHTVLSAIDTQDERFYRRVREAYCQAMDAGRFKNTYAASNPHEYWAEGVQDWFDCNNPNNDGRIHNGIWRRERLKKYDPTLAVLLAETFGDGAWRYTRSDGQMPKGAETAATRPAGEQPHLAGLDRSKLPAFDFNKSPRIAAPRAAATQR